MTKPRLTFPGIHTDEVVVNIQRRHWSLLFGRMARWLLLLVLPIVVFIIFDATGRLSIDIASIGGAAIMLGVSSYLLIVWLLLFQDWLDYYLDALILSNERIIHIEQKGIFNREVSQLTLDRIQDVTIETKGMLSTMFGFGTIMIETAGEQENFTIDGIPSVEKLQTTILMYAKQAPRMGIERPVPDGKNASAVRTFPKVPPKPTDKPW